MRTIIATVTLILALGFANPNAVQANEAERNEAAIALLKGSGIIDSIDQIVQAVMQQVTLQIKQKKPEIPDDALALVITEASKAFINKKPQFIAEMVTIYAKYFTVEEMRAIADFYETPAGKKAIKVLPQLTAEGMQVGDRWAKAALPDVLKGIKKQLEERGHKL